MTNPTPQVVTLREAVATVLEGWTLPADARKILETAFWSHPPAPEQASGEPDMRAICETLGFDPTNHHNAAKCPYCRPATPTAEPAVAAGGIKTEHGIAWQASAAPQPCNLVMVDGRRWYRDDHPALSASPAAPEVAKPEQQAQAGEPEVVAIRDLPLGARFAYQEHPHTIWVLLDRHDCGRCAQWVEGSNPVFQSICSIAETPEEMLALKVIPMHKDPALLAADGKAGGEVVARYFDLTLTKDEAEYIDAFIADENEPDDEVVRLMTGPGHSGYGLYAFHPDYLDEGAVLVKSLPTPEPMKAADEFELRRLLAEEQYTVRQLNRALREATEAPTFMGEPVTRPQQAAQVAQPLTRRDLPDDYEV